MEDQIKSLIHAHDELMKVHIMGSECITFANAMVELTRAINELQAEVVGDKMEKKEGEENERIN